MGATAAKGARIIDRIDDTTDAIRALERTDAVDTFRATERTVGVAGEYDKLTGVFSRFGRFEGGVPGLDY
jgi:hypothetical protein